MQTMDSCSVQIILFSKRKISIKHVSDELLSSIMQKLMLFFKKKK